jgi:hypothetical protein
VPCWPSDDRAISRSEDGSAAIADDDPQPSFAVGRNTFDQLAAEPERSSTAVMRRLALRAGRVDLADRPHGERFGIRSSVRASSSGTAKLMFDQDDGEFRASALSVRAVWDFYRSP